LLRFGNFQLDAAQNVHLGLISASPVSSVHINIQLLIDT